MASCQTSDALLVAVPTAYDGNVMNQLEHLQSAIRTALEPFENVAFVFLFGSAVSGRLRSDSDLDVAVYADSGRFLEIVCTPVISDSDSGGKRTAA